MLTHARTRAYRAHDREREREREGVCVCVCVLEHPIIMSRQTGVSTKTITVKFMCCWHFFRQNPLREILGFKGQIPLIPQ